MEEIETEIKRNEPTQLEGIEFGIYREYGDILTGIGIIAMGSIPIGFFQETSESPVNNFHPKDAERPFINKLPAGTYQAELHAPNQERQFYYYRFEGLPHDDEIILSLGSHGVWTLGFFQENVQGELRSLASISGASGLLAITQVSPYVTFKISDTEFPKKETSETL